MTSTNVGRRAFAQMKIAKILIPSTFIIWCLIKHRFIIVLFRLSFLIGQCVSTSKNYSVFYNIYNMIIIGLIIPISMMVFSLLSIKNIREFQQRIHPRTQIPIITSNGQNPNQNLANKKKYDYQLSFMVLIQQFVYLITNTLYIAYLFYSVITLYWTKTTAQVLIF